MGECGHKLRKPYWKIIPSKNFETTFAVVARNVAEKGFGDDNKVSVFTHYYNKLLL